MGGVLTKKLAGYHQFHAVNFAVEQKLRAAGLKGIWLTGFDAPSLHTMYTEKPIHRHGLGAAPFDCLVGSSPQARWASSHWRNRRVWLSPGRGISRIT